MPNSVNSTPYAAIIGLEPVLAANLRSALATTSCEIAKGTGEADIVFCAPELPVIRQVQSRYPNVPIVVVSRDAEVEAWLDALEAGATDYFAPPFEPIHMRWMLGTHLRTRAFAAA